MNERRIGGLEVSRENRPVAEASTLRGVEVDTREMPIIEIDGRDIETWLRGYDANGIAELEEDPELMISEADKLGVDSEKLIEAVLSELGERLDAFKGELADMSEGELKRRYIDSINGEGIASDFAFVFPGIRLSEYDKLLRDRAEDIGKAQERRMKRAA